MAVAIVQCPKTGEEVQALMEKDLAPMLMKYLSAEQEHSDQRMGLDIGAFMAAWEQGGIRLIMAYDADKNAVGFMPCFVFRPLFVDGAVMVVERWYATTDAVKDEMFKYLEQIIPVLGISQVHIAAHNRHKPSSFLKFNDDDSYQMLRLKV